MALLGEGFTGFHGGDTELHLSAIEWDVIVLIGKSTFTFPLGGPHFDLKEIAPDIRALMHTRLRWISDEIGRSL